MRKAGANAIVPLHKRDEIKGQADTFKQWLGLISRVLGDDVTSEDASLNGPQLQVEFLESAVPAVSDKGTLVPVVANKELLQDICW